MILLIAQTMQSNHYALIAARKVKQRMKINSISLNETVWICRNIFSLYFSELAPIDNEVVSRNIGDPCKLDNNNDCFFSSDSTFNPMCCSPDAPCGILQGGCNTDADCFENLECVIDTCPDLTIIGAKCCQAPGRKPGTLLKWIK